MSRDQLKPIRIGEILVVNYKGWQYDLSGDERGCTTWSILIINNQEKSSGEL